MLLLHMLLTSLPAESKAEEKSQALPLHACPTESQCGLLQWCTFASILAVCEATSRKQSLPMQQRCLNQRPSAVQQSYFDWNDRN
jgi:hypothetical protein